MALSNLPTTRYPEAIEITDQRNGNGRLEYRVAVRPASRHTAKYSTQLRSLAKARRHARKASEATGLPIIDLTGGAQ